jgi:hypothetical protein
VTRTARRSASIALGFAVLFSTALLPARASVAEDAKKICLERYNVEKAGNTIPAGMPKEKYMKQCTTSIVRNAALEQAAEQEALAQGAGGQGGPLITDPANTPRFMAKPAAPAKPAPVPFGH